MTTRSYVRALETDLLDNAEAWLSSKKSAGKRQTTIDGYRKIVGYFDKFLAEKGMPRAVRNIKREHVQAFIESKLSPPINSTASTYERALRPFFKWLLAEHEISADPMAHMERVRVGDAIKETYSDTDLRKLTGYLSNDKTFLGIRDLAALRCLITLGVRASELADLAVDAEGYAALVKRKRSPSGFVNWDSGSIVLLKTKANTAHEVAIPPRAWRTLKTYMRDGRAERKMAGSDWLWLSVSGKRKTADPGRMTYDGLFQGMKRRCAEAGVTFRGVHGFRHTYVTNSLADGVPEQAIAKRVGWSERSAGQMLARYSRSRAEEIANATAMEHAVGDEY